MFLEADLVRIVRVGFVAVNRLCAVRVLDALSVPCRRTSAVHTSEAALSGRFLLRRPVEPWRRQISTKLRLTVASLGTGGAAGVAAHWRACFKAVELGAGVHLRLLGDSSLRAVGVAVRDRARGAASGRFFVQRVAVDESPVAGCGLRAVVEDPYDLDSLVVISWGMVYDRWKGKYRDHGQQDVAGCGGLEGGDG
jgi:hypothetical protein